MMKTLIGVKILQMTDSGLQEIASIMSENPSKDPKEWSETFSELIGMFYKNEKAYMVTENLGFCVNNLKDKTIVVRGIFNPDSSKDGLLPK
jgi:hypothetical protein